MPEQDNWKEDFRNTLNLYTFGMSIGNDDKIIKKVESILSSQAHALKEQMKACVPDKDTGMYSSSVYNDEKMGFNNCREQTLSAIESIEI